jgi:hypothetical protein
VTFLRLSRWDWLAFAAALALLLAMSLDWYTTQQGEECRRIEKLQSPSGGVQADQIGRDVRRDARTCAEKREKNAWQAPAAIDRFIALVLVVTMASALAAGFLRAAGRRFKSAWTPSAIASFAGLFGALLILYRIFQPPGFNDAAVVKAGAPIALALVGILAIAARAAAAAEAAAPVAEPEAGESEAREPEPPDSPAGPAEPSPSA